VPFSGEIYIEQDDFREVPPPKYYRLSPGKEVRLRNAYFRHRAERGERRGRQHRRGALHLRSGQPRRQLARRPQGQVHHALGLGRPRHLRRNPSLRQALRQGRSLRSCEEGQDVLDNLNPNSLEILTGAKLEPSLANAKLEDRFQFERVGYFCLDPDSTRAIWSSTARSR
jgi:glutaminyl-tRNA synthetase